MAIAKPEVASWAPEEGGLVLPRDMLSNTLEEPSARAQEYGGHYKSYQGCVELLKVARKHVAINDKVQFIVIHPLYEGLRTTVV